MSNFDQEALVALLSDAPDAPPRSVDAIQRHGLLALTRGRAATIAEISRESDLDINETRTGIESLASVGRIETAGEEVIGVGGLTLTRTVHAVKHPSAAMDTAPSSPSVSPWPWGSMQRSPPAVHSAAPASMSR